MQAKLSMIESYDFGSVLGMETIASRIKFVRKGAGLSQEAFGAQLGVSRGAVGNWELGGEISRDNLQAIAKRWRVTLDWLMDGKGQPPSGDELVAAEVFRPGDRNAFSTYDPDEEWKPTPEFEGEAYTREMWTPHQPGALPEVDLKLGAGEGAVGEVLVLEHKGHAYSGHRIVGEWLFPESFLHSTGTSPTQSIVGEISGDSMIPTYLPGDRVVVDLSQSEMTVDGIYMWSDGHSPPQVKRFQRIPFSDPPRVEISSDNKAYRAFEAPLSEVKIFGRVTWHLGRN